MTRSIPTSLLNALFEGGNQANALTDIQPFYGVDLDFDSGTELWKSGQLCARREAAFRAMLQARLASFD